MDRLPTILFITIATSGARFSGYMRCHTLPATEDAGGEHGRHRGGRIMESFGPALAALVSAFAIAGPMAASGSGRDGGSGVASAARMILRLPQMRKPDLTSEEIIPVRAVLDWREDGPFCTVH